MSKNFARYLVVTVIGMVALTSPNTCTTLDLFRQIALNFFMHVAFWAYFLFEHSSQTSQEDLANRAHDTPRS